MHKTGTTSFHAATKQLGYHLPTGSDKQKMWQAILAGDHESQLTDTIGAFDAFEDNPFFWPSIDAADTPFFAWAFQRYPDARFVLTVRADTKKWADSFEKHIRRKRKKAGDKWIGSGLHRKLERVYSKQVADTVSFDECAGIYDRYNAEVRAFFAEHAPERFIELCWEDGHGWPELCGFLGRRKPFLRSFPHRNGSRNKA